MAINIRPFNENENEPASDDASLDARASDFIETLRARITTQDESQRQTWNKAVKPAAKQKPILPARPDWMRPAKIPTATKTSPVVPNAGKRQKRV